MQASLPSYTLEYQLQDQSDGSCMLDGTIRQDNVPPTWQMPLPIVLSFAGNQQARTTIKAAGATANFQLKLPAKPTKVELDPANWVLAEKISARAK